MNLVYTNLAIARAHNSVCVDILIMVNLNSNIDFINNDICLECLEPFRYKIAFLFSELSHVVFWYILSEDKDLVLSYTVWWTIFTKDNIRMNYSSSVYN